jgi:signal transduction histidine kinase/ActR/RegA family two-component response regulator
VERARLVNDERKTAPFLEERLLRLDGTVFDGEVTAIPFAFEGRDGALVFVRDITGRKREEAERRGLEQQLRQAQKMESVGRLAGGIAHDFNNLLMIIQSYTHMLQDDLPSDSALRKNTQEILQAARRAISLTGQMLAFSRKQISSPAVLDLNAVINDTAKMLKRLIGEDIEVRVAPANSLWTTSADSDQIVQVLMNLCINSRDAMPQGGVITMATGNITVAEGSILGHRYVAPGQYVQLSVSDTGTGISKDEQEQIFEPFFTTKEVGKGTGLGLAMVYGIVKQSGGYVWVDSEPGKGACFTIFLPRVQGAATDADTPLNTDAQPRGTETVLVAEDEEALRDAICGYLRDLGYTVLAASSGQQALSVARQQKKIDLLITDVVMPQMSGRELSQVLGSLRPDLKTIHMSGYMDDAVLRHGIQGMDATFLQKPFNLCTLARKVRDALGRTETIQ